MSIDIERLKVDPDYWDGCKAWFLQEHPGKEINTISGIPRPQSEWVDGFPPVGCECEMKHPGIKNHGWQKATIKAYFDDRVAVLSNKNIWSDMNGYACIKIDRELEFRPIRTKEQRQREELHECISEAVGRSAGNAKRSIIADTVSAILSRYNLEPKP